MSTPTGVTKTQTSDPEKLTMRATPGERKEGAGVGGGGGGAVAVREVA